MTAASPARPDPDDAPPSVSDREAALALPAGPALRAFFRITEAWNLDRERTMALLGVDGVSTYSSWKRAPDTARPKLHVVERLSHVLGIYEALHVLLPEEAADGWIHRPNEATPFGGRPAIELMTSRLTVDLATVRQYLDGERHRQMAGHEASSIGTARLTWADTARLIRAGWEPLEPLERVSDPGELDAVLAFRALTDPAARDLAGRLVRVPLAERVHGPGSSDAMTPFLFLPPEGSRFSDGTFGVYYAARDRDTAVAETVFHQGRFLSATREGSHGIEMQLLRASIGVDVHDTRGLGTTRPELVDPDPAHYGASAALARTLRSAGSNGIGYDSVRRRDGQCIALFRPRAVGPVIRDARIRHVWDGERQSIAAAFEITPISLGTSPSPSVSR